MAPGQVVSSEACPEPRRPSGSGMQRCKSWDHVVQSTLSHYRTMYYVACAAVCQSNAIPSLLFADEQVFGNEEVALLAKRRISFLFEPYLGVDVPFEPDEPSSHLALSKTLASV